MQLSLYHILVFHIITDMVINFHNSMHAHVYLNISIFLAIVLNTFIVLIACKMNVTLHNLAFSNACTCTRHNFPTALSSSLVSDFFTHSNTSNPNLTHPLSTQIIDTHSKHLLVHGYSRIESVKSTQENHSNINIKHFLLKQMHFMEERTVHPRGVMI